MALIQTTVWGGEKREQLRITLGLGTVEPFSNRTLITGRVSFLNKFAELLPELLYGS